MHGTRLNLPLGFSPRRSGPKRLGSERCGAALTAPSLRQAFTAVPHPRRGEVSVHTRQLSHIPLATHVRNLSPPLLTRRWHRLRSPRAKAVERRRANRENYAIPHNFEPRCCRTLHYMSTRHARAVTRGKRQTPQPRCGSLREFGKHTPCYSLNRAKMDLRSWETFAKTQNPATQTSIVCYNHNSGPSRVRGSPT